MELLALVGALVLLIVVIAYPYIQDQRERAIAKRLENVHDPAVAASMLDEARQVSQQETGFFQKILRYFWVSWWWR